MPGNDNAWLRFMSVGGVHGRSRSERCPAVHLRERIRPALQPEPPRVSHQQFLAARSLEDLNPDYASALSTVIGLTRPARQAGIAAAGPGHHEQHDGGAKRDRRIPRRRVKEHRLHERGTRQCDHDSDRSPDAAMRTASRTIRPATRCPDPPNARRTPISCVRCVTRYDTTANSPTAAIPSASDAEGRE